MSESFIANCPEATGAMVTTLVTSSGTSQYFEVAGPDLMITVKTAAIYWRWVKASGTVSAATALTQGSWLPIGAVIRVGKPQGATGIAILQDTSAASVFLTAGRGI